MPNRIRRAAAALTIAALLFAAAPAAAGGVTQASDEAASVPLMFDVLVMRPIGLVATIVGTVFYAVPVVPLLAITRPTDMGKPFRPLVVEPARFTFVDPLGSHP